MEMIHICIEICGLVNYELGIGWGIHCSFVYVSADALNWEEG